MHCATTRGKTPAAAGLLLSLLAVLALGGCAAKTPWTGLLEEDQRSPVEAAYVDFTTAQDGCSPGWDAEVEVSWTSSIRDLSFAAYCRMLEPAYLKIIVSNPLGQPLRVIAANDRTYRDLDTVERSIVGGTLRSWAARNDLPLNLVKGNWLDWIGGRSSAAVGQIGDIRLDSQDRGVWLSMAGAGSEPIEEYLLFDWRDNTLVERVLLDERGRPFATLTYLEWQQIDQCLYPVAMSIDGLPLGGRLDVNFSDIRKSEFAPADFNVPVPREYLKTWLP